MVTKFSTTDAKDLSFHNNILLKNANYAGCYYCLNVIPVADISDYTDGGQTALCPKCSIDSLLPNITDINILKEANVEWFSVSPE